MNRLYDRSETGSSLRDGMRAVARWGAIVMLTASGAVLGIEGGATLMHGTDKAHEVGLEFVSPSSGRESFVPVTEIPPRQDAGFLLLMGAEALAGAAAIGRLTSERSA